MHTHKKKKPAVVIPVVTTKYAQYMRPTSELRTFRRDKIGRLILSFVSDKRDILIHSYNYGTSGTVTTAIKIHLYQDSTNKTTFYLKTFDYVDADYAKGSNEPAKMIDHPYSRPCLDSVLKIIDSRLDQK